MSRKVKRITNHREIFEEHMAPFVLNIEEDEEDTDDHGYDDADDDHQATVHPATCPQII